jgi:hypothetical protein
MAESGSPALRPRELRAIRALLTEPTIEKAAKAAKVGQRTLYRWLRREDFRDAFDAARRDALAQSMATLQGVTADAVHALREVLTDANARPADRVSAARAVLDFALRGSEMLDLEPRLAALEADARMKEMRWCG